MIDRRDFLGSVLGMFAAANIPWIARRPNQIPIEQPSIVFSEFKTRLQLDNGYTIQGPSVERLGKDGFVLASIEMTQCLVVRGIDIFYRGRQIEGNYSGRFHGDAQAVNPGDTLKITWNPHFTLSSGKIIGPDDEEFQEYMKKLCNENLNQKLWR